MTTRQREPVLRRVRRALLAREGGGLTDGELLGGFVARRDDAAFAALVRRHCPMVLGVCRRVLRDPHDAEDAFQATFLVLARKGASLRQRERVGNWLHGVAYRTALEAKSVIARRRANERQVTTMPEPAIPAQEPAADWLPLLDEELSRLPEKIRVTVVLCELEGRPRSQVARQLCIPEGTLSSRLATARRRLAARLARRGLVLSGAALAVVAVPAPLVGSTVQAAVASAAVPAHVAALCERMLKAMFLKRLQTGTALGLALTVFVILLGLLPAPGWSNALRPAGTQPQDKRVAPARQQDQPPDEPEQGEDVLALKFSPDGKWLAVAEGRGAGQDKARVRLWDTKTHRPARTLAGPEKWVRGLCFAPKGEIIAGCCDDGKIYLWDTRTGDPRKTLVGHRGTPQAVAFAADGNTLASSGATFEAGVETVSSLILWDVAKGKLLRHVDMRNDGLSGTGTGLAFAPGGKVLAVACAGAFRGVILLDVATGNEVQRLRYDSGFPNAVAFSPDGRWLASGGGDAIPITPNESKIIGHVKVWDRKTGKLYKTLIDPTEGYFRAIVFSKDGKHLFAGSPGPERKRVMNGRRFNTPASLVHCWDTKDWGRFWTVESDGGGVVWALDVSPDGRTVAVSDSFVTGLIHVPTGRWVRPLIQSP
jgi:RNA polymerase sigma factor (sigma-70 family)